MLLLLAAVAVAGVSQAELTAWVAELAPLVEAKAGRRFGRLPSIRGGSREEMLLELGHRPLPLELFPEAAVVAASERERYAQITVNSPQGYDPGSDRIWLDPRPSEASGERQGIPLDIVRAAIRQKVAHELTHALQYRYLGAATRAGDDSGARVALVEGHAAWVERAMADPRLASWLGAFEWCGSPAAVDPSLPDVISHFYGREFVEVYTARFGVDAMWWQLGQTMPFKEQIVAVGQAQLPDGWRLEGALADLLARRWQVHPDDVDFEDMPPHLALWFFGMRAPLPGDDERRAGEGFSAWVTEAGVRHTAAAFLLPDAAAAADVLLIRKAQLEGETPAFAMDEPFEGAPKLRPRTLPAPARPPGSHSSLWLVRPGEDASAVYEEMWAARGPFVYMVARNGVRNGKQLTELLLALSALPLRQQPVGWANSPQATAALDSLAPPSVLPTAGTHGEWEAAQLWSLARAGDTRGCLSEWPRALARAGASGHAYMLSVGLHCAVAERDRAALERVALETEHGADWSQFNLALARALAEEGSGAVASDLLARVPATSPALEPAARELREMLAALAGRWEEVRPVVTNASLPRAHRLWLAARWAQAGPSKAAVAALRQLCGEATEAERLEFCGNAASGAGRGEPPRKTTP